MKGYWLNCEKCNKDYTFKEMTEHTSLTSFLWNEFLDSRCDQSLLTFKCPVCNGLVRITYHFPRAERLTVKVKHIVYRTCDEDFYQMLWETYFIHEPDKPVYDFKYISDCNATGLNRPAIMAEKHLQELVDLFNLKCHKFLK